MTMAITELDVAFTERFTPAEEKTVGAGGTAFVLPDDSPEQPQGFFPVHTPHFQNAFGFHCRKCHLMYAVAPARVFHCKVWESRPVEVATPIVAAASVRVPQMTSPTLHQRIKSFVIRYL